jgi:hypothetical protein
MMSKTEKIEMWSKEVEDFDKYIRLFLYDKKTLLHNDQLFHIEQDGESRRQSIPISFGYG